MSLTITNINYGPTPLHSTAGEHAFFTYDVTVPSGYGSVVAKVELYDQKNRLVASVSRLVPVSSDGQAHVQLEWDGTDGAGDPVPPGDYGPLFRALAVRPGSPPSGDGSGGGSSSGTGSGSSDGSGSSLLEASAIACSGLSLLVDPPGVGWPDRIPATEDDAAARPSEGMVFEEEATCASAPCSEDDKCRHEARAPGDPLGYNRSGNLSQIFDFFNGFQMPDAATYFDFSNGYRMPGMNYLDLLNGYNDGGFVGEHIFNEKPDSTPPSLTPSPRL